MNFSFSPDAQTRAKCEAFADELVKWLERERQRHGITTEDMNGVLFGMGMGAALQSGDDVEELCKVVRTLARLHAGQKQK